MRGQAADVGGRRRNLARRLDRRDARVVEEGVARRLQQLVLQDRAVVADADLDRRGQPRQLRSVTRPVGVVQFLRTARRSRSRKRRRRSPCSRCRPPTRSAGPPRARSSAAPACARDRARAADPSRSPGRRAAAPPWAPAALGSSAILMRWRRRRRARRLGDARQPELLARLAELDQLRDHEVARHVQRLLALAVRERHRDQDRAVERERDQQAGEVPARGAAFVLGRHAVTPAGR